jgi:hypothetical protein
MSSSNKVFTAPDIVRLLAALNIFLLQQPSVAART